MKLRTKVGLSFAVAFLVSASTLYFGLVYILDTVSLRLMTKQAEDITLLIEHEIIDNSSRVGAEGHSRPADIFDRVKHVSDEGGSFEIAKILLLDRELMAVAAFPESETGADYSSHSDIREALEGRKKIVAVETPSARTGVLRREIDIVSWFLDDSGTEYAIEVKLDFAKSTALLENQYAFIEAGAIGVALALFAFLLGALLALVGRSAILPVTEITGAMQKVGTGDLGVTLGRTGTDEFGQMAARFNEMVRGLREKTTLSKYVSQSTAAAVRDSVGTGKTDHEVRRRRCSLFFSDIRGFTAYSESRDPAKVVETLNRILSLQAGIIRRRGGDIDKFVGDEVMAVFDGSLAAIESAVEIQKEMAAKRADIDGLSIGIGIHEGEVVEGDVGSDDIRNFTVIGDTVNTAARLEAKAGPGQILVSEAAAAGWETRARFAFGEMGELALKGKEVGIRTFSVKGTGKP